MSIELLEETQQEDIALEDYEEGMSHPAYLQADEAFSASTTNPVLAPQVEPTEVLPTSGLELLSVNADGIPDSLKELPSWVHWKVEINEKGKPTKVPYIVGGTFWASSTNPATWKGYKEAISTKTC